MNKKELFLFEQQRNFAYLIIVPAAITVTTLVIVPILYSLYVVLHDWSYMRPFTKGEFIGLGNFLAVITEEGFINTLRSTFIFTTSTLALEIFIGLGAVLAIDKIKKGRMLIYGLIILPWAIPNVINALMWKWIFNPYYGLFNALLVNLKITSSYGTLLGKPGFAMAAIINSQVWRELPFVIFILGAGLQSIPPQLYEAAKVDGAKSVSIFRYITLPWLYPSIMIVLIFETMNSLRVFDIIWIMTYGGPGDSTAVLAWRTYMKAFLNFDFGQGIALSYIIMIITLIFAAIYIKVFLRTEFT